jgi:predicted esterase
VLTTSLALLAAPLAAAEIRLKCGMTFRGTATDIESLVVGPKKPKPGPVPIYPITMVSTPLVRYFVPFRQREVVNRDVELTSRQEGFKLSQQKRQGGGRIIGSVQGYVDKPDPFDEYGRRTVRLQTASGEERVIQGVTLITPEYVKLMALNFTWETAIATSSVPLPQLDAMLRKVTNENNPEQRLKIAIFYIQAGFYEPAQRELEAIRTRFPELVDTVTKAQVVLTQAMSQELLGELKLRRAAGQHKFVYEALKKFPVENVAPVTLREVRDMTAEYEQALERAHQVVARLGELQALLKDDPRVKEIAPLRTEMAEKLTYSSLNRLDAFTKLAGDPQLKPDEKLALALSGWVVGSANAVTELNEALRFWQARFLLLDYLRSSRDADTERKAILTKLESLEGIGPDRLAQLIAVLPPARDPTGASPGQAVRVELPGVKDMPAAAYWVSLPYEYHRDHSYPMIVALHSESGSPQQELQGFWGGTEQRGGQSQRHGYIVIAPEYVSASQNKLYDYSAESHQIVLESLRDALLRYNVDANRVFLAGHGMGGDATIDMGLSHPHLFAGIIPINGAIDRHAPPYLENGKQLPTYLIGGELDRNLMDCNVGSLMKMMTGNFELIYAEFVGAGPDSFYSEIHQLFEWMGKQTRDPPPNQINAKTLRECDNEFWWFELGGIPEQLKGIDWAAKPRAVHPLSVSAKITPGNTISISSRAAFHRVWLARGEGLVDFGKRLKVEINSKQVFNDFVKPDVAAMLERVRTHGDRQMLFWGVLEFGK